MNPQTLEALERANEIRSRRAQLKRAIHDGETRVTRILSEPIPDWLASMRLGELLEAVPFVGPARAFRYLADIGNVSYVRRLDRLTARQKLSLVVLLEAKEKELERQRPYKKRARRSYEKRHG